MSSVFKQGDKRGCVVKRKELEAVLKGLLSVKASPYFEAGICSNLRCSIDNPRIYHEDWVKEQYPRWRFFSGNGDFPVEGSGEGYSRAQDLGESWLKSTLWGRRRWDLLDFLIRRARADLKAMKKKGGNK